MWLSGSWSNLSSQLVAALPEMCVSTAKPVSFVLQSAIKQLCKPFEPAQDRFEGVATEVDEDSGCVILKEAAAYVTCSIKDRIEAGDHWIVYATVDGGKVLAPDAQTAVHHRKAGNHY